MSIWSHTPCAMAALSYGIDFENTELTGKIPQYSLTDDGKTTGPTFWYFSGDSEMNLSLIRAYSASEQPGPDWPPPGAGWPDMTTDIGLLSASTSTNILYRTFRSITSPTGPTKSQSLIVPESGYFFDAYVNLGSSVEAPDPALVLARGDKLQVSLLERNEETGVLVVTAASVGADGIVTPVNFVTTNVLQLATWHRLTARIIANASTKAGETLSAIALWLDGERMSCSAEEYAAKIGAGAAVRFIGNEEYENRSLYPILQASESKMRLYSVGIGGDTLVDDIQLGTKNTVDHEATEIVMVLVCDDDAFSAMSYVMTPYGSEPETEVVLTKPFSGTKVTVMPGDKVEFKPVKIGRAETTGAFTFSGNTNAVDKTGTSAYTVLFREGDRFESAERLLAKISATVYNFKVAGRDCVTFEEAVCHADTNGVSNVIELKGDVKLDAAATKDNGQARVYANQNVVLDLRGSVLKGSHFNSEAAIYDQGRLEILDTVGGGAIEAVGDAIEVVSANDALDVNHGYAEVSLGRAAVTNQFRVHGRVKVSNENAILKIRLGEYLTPPDVSPDTFYLDKYRADRTVEPVRFDVAGTGTYWRVSFDDLYHVTYETSRGTVSPSEAWVAADSTLTEPALLMPGYTNGGWFVKGAAEPRAKWVFGAGGDKVGADLVLESSPGLDAPYSITYDPPMSGIFNPASYTVEDSVTILGLPTSNLLVCAAWRDANSGHLVNRVGAHSKYSDADLEVSGNLDLRADWKPVAMVWSNSVHKASVAESNGVYSGSWQLKLPKTWRKSNDCLGRLIRIREIDFCIVNPHLYPKTAPRLAVKKSESETVVSAVRTNYFNAATQEYEVGTNVLANGRAKVAYLFDDLTVRADVSNELFFVDAEAKRVPGFLRLGYGAGAAVGNCLGPGGDLEDPSELYLDYAPIYEIFGEAAE